VAELAQRTLPGCDGASVALVVEEATFTGASSSQLAIEADMVQYRQDEGPCLRAVDEASTVRIDLLADDERFEHFAPAAIDVGVESVLSIPLETDGVVVGSINLYSSRPNAFADDDAARIAPLSEYATSLIAASSLYESTVDLLERLVEVVDDAAQVEIAVGVLIVRRDMTASEAWDHLTGLAATSGTSIIDTARRLVDEHEAQQGDR
jgi:GAF domain-containing protein